MERLSTCNDNMIINEEIVCFSNSSRGCFDYGRPPRNFVSNSVVKKKIEKYKYKYNILMEKYESSVE